LEEAPEQASYLALLKIFSYGTYAEYKTTADLPSLNEQQTQKLRQLSFLTLAKNPSNLSYASLLQSLSLETPRELEDLVISAIYAGLVSGTLDPYNQVVNLSSVSPLRDLPPNSVPSMINTLNEWSSRCVATLADLEKQIAQVKADALKRHREEQDWAAQVEKLVEGKPTDKGKNEEGDSFFQSVNRKLGGGSVSKRGIMDAEDADDMDIDDDEEYEGDRRGSRSKKRGLLGSLR
jgi:COP9 signalosome complex subunit 7